MKLGMIFWLTIALVALPRLGALHKVDSLFSYRTPDSKNPVTHKSDRNLILGFGMSDEEKEEERRKEARKDDVKNLIKVDLTRSSNWPICSMTTPTSMSRSTSNSKTVLLTVEPTSPS